MDHSKYISSKEKLEKGKQQTLVKRNISLGTKLTFMKDLLLKQCFKNQNEFYKATSLCSDIF